MLIRSLILTLLIVAAGCATAPPQPAQAEWTRLFDGETLTGWNPVGTAIWRVEAGVIIGTQDGDPKRSGVLETVAEYRDFELELEFLLDEHGKYNSGVYLRNTRGKAGRTGYQINIGRGAVGEFCGGIYTDKWLAKGDETDTIRKQRDWNHLRILARGAHVEVTMNGQKIVDFTDPDPKPGFLNPGVLAFQTYGAEGHSGFVKFRNLRLRTL